MIPTAFLGTWARKSAQALFSAIHVTVFLFLDGIECILCVIFRFLDSFFEGKASTCYCVHGGEICDGVSGDAAESEGEMSESLYRREHVFRKCWVVRSARKHVSAGPEKRVISGSGGGGGVPVRWSDCRCQACISWINDKEQKLRVVVKEPSRGNASTQTSSLTVASSLQHQRCCWKTESLYSDAADLLCFPAISSGGKAPENVIFLHGFLASSSLWTELVFPNLSESGAAGYRLFAVDLLGFGMSPKPRDCFYTLRDHIEMIEKSVICPFQLESFHIVAHSMGCVIAVALASKYKKSVKSVTLTAPPYLPSAKGDASLTALRRLAEKKLWPPPLFGSSVMSWYEHLGRCVCFLVCRNHRMWERIIKLITRRRDLYFPIVDLTRHTHHSAWHTMHNVICGGMRLMDGYLVNLRTSGAKLSIVHGDRDRVIPLECGLGIKLMVPNAEANIILDADHNTVMFGREREFTRYLERVWDSSSSIEG